MDLDMKLFLNCLNEFTNAINEFIDYESNHKNERNLSFIQELNAKYYDIIFYLGDIYFWCNKELDTSPEIKKWILNSIEDCRTKICALDPE
jgi:hypothetical protein